MTETTQRRFTAADITRITGVKQNRLHSWMERGLFMPSIHKGQGSGDHNIYNETDVYRIALFLHMVEFGLPRKKVGACIAELKEVFNQVDVNDVVYFVFGWAGDGVQVWYADQPAPFNKVFPVNIQDVFVINFNAIRWEVQNRWKK